MLIGAEFLRIPNLHFPPCSLQNLLNDSNVVHLLLLVSHILKEVQYICDNKFLHQEKGDKTVQIIHLSMIFQTKYWKYEFQK